MLAAVVFIPVTAMSVDVARWYVELERVQTAADAGATAGVTYMPDDFANAKTTAIAVSGRNGYPNSGTSTVTVEATSKPSQLKVTVSSKIRNAFGTAFGEEFTTVVAFRGRRLQRPGPHGQPLQHVWQRAARLLSTPTRTEARGASVIVAPAGGASCTSNPQFWGAIAGPNTAKQSGDAFMTRTCSSGNSGCTGTVNNEFNPLGYFYIVRVGPAAVGLPMTIQIYDPAFVEVGDQCEKGPSGTPVTNGMNPYVPLDAAARYTGGNASPFCNGDVLGGGNAADIVTSYGLRLPTDTYQPKLATPVLSCEKQYPGWASTTTTAAQLNQASSATVYKPDVAQVFRQWVDLCTFTPTQSGDHYLQIRTNVALGGTTDGQGGYQNNPAVFSQADDNTAVIGNGNNRFAIRVKGTARASISVGRVPVHGDVRELLQRVVGRELDVQPGAGRPGSGDEDAQDRLLRHR